MEQVTRMDNLTEYLDRMAKSSGETSKIRLLDFIPKSAKRILDFGCANGAFTTKIADAFPNATVIGYDKDYRKIGLAEMTNARDNIIYTDYRSEAFLKDLDVIVCSSVLHEVFSYADIESSHSTPFNYSRLDNTLSNFLFNLKDNGTLLIRDGVKDNRYAPVRIHFKDSEGPHWLDRFKNEFKGLVDEGVIITKIDDMTYEFNSEDYAREFLYTYTWGPDSWNREVKEQFGYYNEKEYAEYLKALGFNVISHSAFTELGYYYHLGTKIDFTDKDNNPIDLPYSTIFIVAEKKTDNSITLPF